jgi:SAM-dependent methyltransferase
MIDILGPGSGRFLDPFCGGGVALIEAWTRGYEAVGIDVNRFAVNLVTAKAELMATATTAQGAELADEYTEQVARSRSAYDGLSGAAICQRSGMHSEATNWFEQDVLADIAAALSWIRSHGDRESQWLWVLLSSLLHRSSVLRDVHYTYIVDRSRTSSPPKTKVDLPGDFEKKIRRSLKDAHRARTELLAARFDLNATPRPVARAGRAEEATVLVEAPVDLIVTSPPYFGMNDYVRSQYLSWLVEPWDGYEQDRLGESGPRRGRRSGEVLDAYKCTMNAALRQSVDLLRPGGYLVMVIGASRSAISRDRDPVASVRAAVDDLELEMIWTGSRRVRYRKINNSPSCAEEIWVMRA